MRSAAIQAISILSLALAGGAIADPAPATTTPAASKPAKKGPSPDDMICTQEQVTGSIFPKRVCMTRAQRDQQDGETKVRVGQGQTHTITGGGSPP